MATSRISKRSIDALTCEPGKDRTFLWDDALAGFGVGAFASGKKVYVAQYRQAGRSRRITIGEHGRLTPDEARREAKKLLGAIENGADPIAQRQASRAVPTFAECADAFMNQHGEAKLKPRTVAGYGALFRSHIGPAIGAMRITDIRRADVSKLHHSLLNTPGAANRTIAAISAIWNWTAGERDDLTLPPNPCKGIKRNPEEGRERFLSGEELARLGNALAEAERTGLPCDIDDTKPTAKHAPKPENRRRKIDPFAIAAIRLLILTGARLNEIMTAKWDYIDFERGLMNLPTSKTGKKSIFLSAAALEVLSNLPRVEGNQYVLPGEGKKDVSTDKGGNRIAAPRADLKRPWAAVTDAAGLQGLRIHDLQHSFASIGAGASLGLPIIGKLLGHSQPATTARYAHLDADPMRRAVETIGNTISAAMNRNPSGTIVASRKSVG